MLCPPCDAILCGKTQPVESSGILSPVHIQHKDLSSLKSALSVGCYVCSFFMHKFREEEIENLWHQEPEGCATSVFFNKKEYMDYAGSFYIFMQLGAGVKVKHVGEGTWPVPPNSLFIFQPVIGKVISSNITCDENVSFSLFSQPWRVFDLYYYL